MFPAIYVENTLKDHPRVRAICERFKDAPVIPCERYTEVFNRKAQNFRLQKQKPSLILAKKHKNFLLPTPKSYGIGSENNFYFSHMFNCIYDCRYCFLQGMYSSAHYVVFVNYEDFLDSMEEKLKGFSEDQKVYFFSGYDCDSLALEPVTHFINAFLPLFKKYPKRAFLELRTKSPNIQALLNQDPLPNCIVAFSLTPKEISRSLEHKTPSIEKRLRCLKTLQDYGWPLGLRFDPLIYTDNYKQLYKELFDSVFSLLDPERIHSVSMGPFRLPKPIYKNMTELYPKEKLFVYNMQEHKQMISYPEAEEREMVQYCTDLISSYIPESRIFPCNIGGHL